MTIFKKIKDKKKQRRAWISVFTVERAGFIMISLPQDVFKQGTLWELRVPYTLDPLLPSARVVN